MPPLPLVRAVMEWATPSSPADRGACKDLPRYLRVHAR
jgi:hypothetical protein